MKIIELNQQQIMYLLTNEKPFSRGQFGILTLLGDKVYKIHYKKLIDTYFSKDSEDLESEIETLTTVEETLKKGLYNPKVNADNFQRLENTRTNNLITGVLAYKGIYVGIEMNYLERYKSFKEISKKMDAKSLEESLKNIGESINDLLENNIVPNDIKEDNILIDPTNLDIKIIDLDGIETVYGPENYVKEYPYTRSSVMRKYKEMRNRVINREEIDR